MQVKELVYPSAGSVPYLNVQTRASWGAIFVGAVVSIAAFIMLTMLGAGIGLMSAPAADDPRSLGVGLGIGAAVWYLISSVIAFYIGGWFAGRLTGIGRVSESVVHGIASWGLVTVVVAFMTVFTAGQAMSGLFGILGQGVSGGITGAAAGAAGGGTDLRDAPANIKEKLKEFRQEAKEYRKSSEAKGDSRGDTRDAPAPVEKGARAAGAAGLIGFAAMFLQAASAGFGARAGTRVLRPGGLEAHRVRA